MKTMASEEQKNEETPTRPDAFLIASIMLFAIVCAISTFLFFDNTRLANSIEANQNETIGYINSIEKIKSSGNIAKAELVTANKPGILSIIQQHEAQRYITELRDISAKYKMMFSGFSYTNGKIATSAVAIPERVLVGEDGMKKISDFVRDYRTGTGLLFQLAPVLSVSGYEQKRSFSIDFSVATSAPLQK